MFPGGKQNGRGKEGVRVAEVPLERNALLLSVSFVARSVSHLFPQALTMLLCFASVCGVFFFLLAFLWAAVWIQMPSGVTRSDFELISPVTSKLLCCLQLKGFVNQLFWSIGEN